MAGDQFAVEPGRSVMADLLAKADVGDKTLIRMFARSRARS